MPKKLMKVTNGCKLTIPKQACKETGLTPGDYVFVEWENGKLAITPAQVTSREG